MTKPLSTKNIPEGVLVGMGTMTVLECKNKDIFESLEKQLRGGLFHLKKDDRYFIAVSKDVVKELEDSIER